MSFFERLLDVIVKQLLPFVFAFIIGWIFGHAIGVNESHESVQREARVTQDTTLQVP
jgi:hypothetical protein